MSPPQYTPQPPVQPVAPAPVYQQPAPYVPPAPPPANPEVDALKAQIASLQQEKVANEAFINDATIVVNAIEQNPALKTQLKDQIQRGFAPQQPLPIQPVAPVSPQVPVAPTQDQQLVSNLDMKARKDIVAQTEAAFGYSSLEQDKIMDIRRKVGNTLSSWGTSIINAPVDTLQKVLKDAYLINDIGNAKDQGRLAGLVDAHQNDQGAFPSMGSAPQATGDTTAQMDEHHNVWSDKLGVPRDKTAENLKEFTETGKITYKAPPPAQPVAQLPAPSGTPQPPVAPAAQPAPKVYTLPAQPPPVAPTPPVQPPPVA